MSKAIKIVIALIIAIILTAGFLYVKLRKEKIDNQKNQPAEVLSIQQSERSTEQEQLENLNNLRKENDDSTSVVNPDVQMQELDRLRKESAIKPPTQQEIDVQLKELDVLRNK